MDRLKPFPLEKKIEKIFSRTPIPENWRPTCLAKNFYVQLSEPVVRQAVAWLDAEGRIIDPYEHKETFTTTPRFVGALGFLIRAGACEDLIKVCARSMTKGCEDLFYADQKLVPGLELYVKELMVGYCALKDRVPKNVVEQWKKHLSGYDPENNYVAVLSRKKPEDLHNFCTFAIAGEVFKKKYEIADNTDFIERYIETQKQWFTEFGMYRDPDDPMTYDLVSRMNLCLALFFGYHGRHKVFLDEILRLGALTMLLYQSPTGEAPFGGRSNQQNFNEATISLICEYEANRYKALGQTDIAGAFKRAAHLAALSVKRWLDMQPIRFTKNEFPPDSQHGRQSYYGFYGAYSLLISSLFGFAHLLADDSIEERPLPSEKGGCLLHLPDAFHKIFATCHSCHIEIDTRADHHYDATGLGRFHRACFPTELGLSSPITSTPGYLVSVTSSPRSIAIGPGWQDNEGKIHWLSDLSDEIVDIKVKDIKEEINEVRFKVIYSVKLKNSNTVIESYRLNASGLEIEDKILGSVKSMLVQIPLLKTVGQNSSAIEVGKREFRVKYKGYVYTVECISQQTVSNFLEPFFAPNRNGIYAVGCFKAEGSCIKYKISLNPA